MTTQTVSVTAYEADFSDVISDARACDVSVDVEVNGRTLSGTVTLLPCSCCQGRRHGYSSDWAQDRNAWVSGQLLRALEAEISDDVDFRAALGEIAAVAAKEC